ncbi:MAG: hypothetical protein ABIJ21_03445 [Nanoarchaeota archaeon]
MGKNEFNKELDRYISKKRKPAGITFGFSIRRKKSVTETPNEARAYAKGKPGKSRWFSRKRAEERPMDVEKYEELEEELENIEKKKLSLEEKEMRKEGVMKRFFKFFSIGKQEVEEEMMEEENAAPEIADDVKEVLKLSLKWIEMLPSHKMRDFKSSPDFEKYKEVLLKYNVARKK